MHRQTSSGAPQMQSATNVVDHTYTHTSLRTVPEDQSNTKRTCYNTHPTSRQAAGLESRPNLSHLARVDTVGCDWLLNWLIGWLVELCGLVKWPGGVWFRPVELCGLVEWLGGVWFRPVELCGLVEWPGGVWFRPCRMVQSNRSDSALDRPVFGMHWIRFRKVSIPSVLKFTLIIAVFRYIYLTWWLEYSRLDHSALNNWTYIIIFHSNIPAPND